MAISSAMYAAVTGLSALSTGMQTISNNIANVNTVGFKASRTNFEDLISQDYWSNGKIQQIGRGVKVSSVQSIFTQGSFINSEQDTDIAIAGDGFFQVRDRVTNNLVYTRAGNFTFDRDGFLESPSGYVLQGWQLSIPKPGEDPVRLGAPVDIKVIALNAPPVETSMIKVVTNLDANDKTAYKYPKEEWADKYADQVAIPLAKAAQTTAYNNWLVAHPGDIAGAQNAGQAAYNTTYETEFKNAKTSIEAQLPPWQLEGNGFAGAWDGTKVKEPISPTNYTHSNPWVIYDSLGREHKLMVYYQPNPHMENVWDYIVTGDPNEDARKDSNNKLYMSGASFAGLFQKGKLTFTADGPDRHGGNIKDIESQNLDPSKTKVATCETSAMNIINPATASAMAKAKIGGYYTGKPVFSASTGSMEPSNRTYRLEWNNSLTGSSPAVSGFTWTDNSTPPNTGQIPVTDKNYVGPYNFGSGLNVSFNQADIPLRFTNGDWVDIKATSESIGWINEKPNAEGYYDFEVAFVQSASLATHPPYPGGLPTISQTISINMGAKNPLGLDSSWTLDEQGTTQYGSKSTNIFSSQDGYPAGSLQRVSIDKDGVLTGVYTNGRQQALYQIGLTRFLNPWGLAKMGDNVFEETRWSGSGTINPPGYGGTGTVRGNFLEQSNVDLASEIVNMIVTQRGFQANSKVVTTTDTMLAEVIEMKR